MSGEELENFRNSVILVTGASGFIGASFVRHLLATGASNVHIVVRKNSNLDHLSNLVSRLQVHVLQQSNTLFHIISSVEPSYIFHFAFSNINESATYVEKVLSSQENVAMDFQLLEGARVCKVKSLFIAGSSLVYADAGDKLRMDGKLSPINLKGVLKRNSELLYSYFLRKFSLPIRIGRIFRCYGPLEPDHRLIKTAIRHNISGDPMPLSDPRYSRDYIYIDDLIEGIIRYSLARSAPFILNFGFGRSYSAQDVCEEISRITGINMKYSTCSFNGSVAERAISRADIYETTKCLNWRPGISLEEGLRKIIDHD